MILQLIGLIGTGLYVLAYALLQSGRLRAEERRYSALNGAAAVLLLISLTETFHLASTVSNLVWLALSVQGYLRATRARPKVLLDDAPDIMTRLSTEVAQMAGAELHQLVPEPIGEPSGRVDQPLMRAPVGGLHPTTAVGRAASRRRRRLRTGS